MGTRVNINTNGNQNQFSFNSPTNQNNKKSNNDDFNLIWTNPIIFRFNYLRLNTCYSFTFLYFFSVLNLNLNYLFIFYFDKNLSTFLKSLLRFLKDEYYKCNYIMQETFRDKLVFFEEIGIYLKLVLYWLHSSSGLFG